MNTRLTPAGTTRVSPAGWQWVSTWSTSNHFLVAPSAELAFTRSSGSTKTSARIPELFGSKKWKSPDWREKHRESTKSARSLTSRFSFLSWMTLWSAKVSAHPSPCSQSRWWKSCPISSPSCASSHRRTTPKWRSRHQKIYLPKWMYSHKRI